jgi:dihydrofolate reductase
MKEPSVRELIVPAFVTLDGVMQGPGGPDEDPSGGFTQGGWGVTQWDETMYAAMGEMFAEPFDLLLGRRTYEIFAAHWPHVGEGQREGRGGTASDVDDPAAAALNSARKYVASRTLETLTWNNSVLLEGSVADAVAKLKTADGPALVTQGSTDLIQTLLDHDLVDEFRIWTFPVVVGPGKRLFGRGTTPGGMRLVDTKTSSTGVVMATYRCAGDAERGSFEFDEPTDEELERRRRLAAEG